MIEVGVTMAESLPALGLGEPIYNHAKVFNVCSLQIACEVLRESPEMRGFCPIRIFVYNLEGVVTLGFANFPDIPQTRAVQALLAEITAPAATAGF